MSRPGTSAASSVLRLPHWSLLASVAVVLAVAIWFIGGADGLFRGRAGFADVSGTWRLDAAAYEAMVAAKESHLAARPGGAVDARLTAARLRTSAAPYSKRRYSFMADSYAVAEEGLGPRETACTYAGESARLLHVIGADPGEADDLAIILDPALGCIHLRLENVTLPFVRE